MANTYIKGASGGETTTPTGDEGLPLDDGTSSTWIAIKNLIIRKLRETSGPTSLSMGSVADGEFLKRSGTSIIGASGGGVYGSYFSYDGIMLNGKISVSVASNNITVAIKTLAGTDPSSSDPVYIRINGTVRSVTAALSVTKNAGTNWFNSGSTELATKEIDYFVYLIWNTTPATDIVDIGFARVPNFCVYSDASSTTTNEKYLAFGNASTPTSTDDMVCIGRFAATLSASASYNWSVPTFTSKNLIQYPILNSRWLDITPNHTGFSSAPTGGLYQYQVWDGFYKIRYGDQNTGTSNAITYTIALPFTSAATADQYALARIVDNSAALSAGGRARIALSSNTLAYSTSWTGGAFTSSGGKGAHCQMDVNF